MFQEKIKTAGKKINKIVKENKKGKQYFSIFTLLELFKLFFYKLPKAYFTEMSG